MKGTGIPVDKAITLSLPVFPHPAKAPFPLADTTPSGTQFTLDFFSVKHSEPRGKLFLNETFFDYLRLGGFRQTEQGGE